jgi:hypothetical protein
MSERKYRIICLKRSECKMEDGYFRWIKAVYWMPNRAGYTNDPEEAGIYSGIMVEDCSGCKGDWLLEPISRAERFPVNMNTAIDGWDY